MKYTVAIAICIMVLTGCADYHTESIRDGRTSITVKESDHKYRIDVRFNGSKASELAGIIDEELDSSGSIDAQPCILYSTCIKVVLCVSSASSRSQR